MAAGLFSEEELTVVCAISKRQGEFARPGPARAALAQPGLPSVPIPRGPRGAPEASRDHRQHHALRWLPRGRGCPLRGCRDLRNAVISAARSASE